MKTTEIHESWLKDDVSILAMCGTLICINCKCVVTPANDVHDLMQVCDDSMMCCEYPSYTWILTDADLIP